jgi:peptidyl-tRNA hydrolase, PTH1 family
MPDKFLIVGLGNIGAEYANTRHNIGFDIVDHWCATNNAIFTIDRLAAMAQLSLKGRKVTIIKPTTFMNLSGKAVKYWMDKEQIALENILIITDDLALPIEKVRLRTKGSHAGHNGLRSIEEVLGTQEFARLRIGIGNNFSKGQQADFVLGKWNKDEIELITQKIKDCALFLQDYILVGSTFVMNKINAHRFI